MKIKAVLLLATVLCLGLPPLIQGEKATGSSWTGNYTDQKYCNGQAVFELNVLQKGAQITVDFDAAYNDGHGCAPEGSGPAKVVDKNTLKFTFTDSANNAGVGTIKRVGDGVSSQSSRLAWQTRAVLFSTEKTSASSRRVSGSNVGGACVPRSPTLRTYESNTQGHGSVTRSLRTALLSIHCSGVAARPFFTGLSSM